MATQYAIMEIIPKDGRSLEESTTWNSDVVYHPVPQEVAETNENGFFSLINNFGQQVTPWVELNDRKAEEANKKVAAAKNTGPIQKDIMGEELAVGDYVSYSSMETADLFVGKVVAFTPKKVRILTYDYWHDVVAKNASGLVKIHPSILSD